MIDWTAILTELIRRASCDLPADVEERIRQCRASETEGSPAAIICSTILENSALARAADTPICQDTGTLSLYFDLPFHTTLSPLSLQSAANEAVRSATANGWLRRNTIESISGTSIDDNIAPGSPDCHFDFSDRSDAQVTLLMKGGGCENMSSQYSLPDRELKAGRDLNGVRKCLLHAIWQVQGQGCAPGILGVCIGADRANGYAQAKRQLLRPLTDSSPDLRLAELEDQILAESATLGIGPMGMGGKTTLLGVKITAAPRLPASYFVTIAYMCWACRRHTITVPLA
ncbi:MAG: fumarate hydratase [Lentisphaerae bacterium]|jgi:fumarate hydratase class I|nr:fumarate hydratase [Lentisphaerota bacterium]